MIKSTYPGKFIVIEGLDGCGKSAHVELIKIFLQEKGKIIVETKEPTMESEAGRKIKQLLRGEIKLEPMERQKLYVQDRNEHLKNKVIPAVKEGKFVVCSRYAFSTIAYGSSDGLDTEVLVGMTKDFLLPDLTIIINVSPAECIKRIEKRGEVKELWEKKAKLERVDKVYQKFPGMFENIVMINGERSIEEVFEDIKKEINKII
jgi:dTMP kinase